MDIVKYPISINCRKLPKVELHAHLNGSLSRETMRKLCSTKCYSFQHYLTVSKPDSFSSLKECLSAAFSHAHYVTDTPKAIFIATCDVIREFHEDNVIYLELRSTPRHVKSSNGIMTKEQYLEAMIKAIKKCKSEISILVKLLVSIDRSKDYLSAKENVELAIEFKKKYPEYVVGIDVSGNPTKIWQYNGTTKSIVEILEMARKADLKTTVHCAEVPFASEVVEILKFKPDRLGHCTCIHPTAYKGSEELFNMLLASKVPVELCLTSNVKCQTVSTYTSHHFIHLFKAGHPIVIGTDDKGIFDTCLSQEYSLIKSTFNFGIEALQDLSAQSVQYSFATPKEKKYLTKIIDKFEPTYEM